MERVLCRGNNLLFTVLTAKATDPVQLVARRDSDGPGNLPKLDKDDIICEAHNDSTATNPNAITFTECYPAFDVVPHPESVPNNNTILQTVLKLKKALSDSPNPGPVNAGGLPATFVGPVKPPPKVQPLPPNYNGTGSAPDNESNLLCVCRYYNNDFDCACAKQKDVLDPSPAGACIICGIIIAIIKGVAG